MGYSLRTVIASIIPGKNIPKITLMLPLVGPNKNGNKNILSMIPRRDNGVNLRTALCKPIGNA